MHICACVCFLRQAWTDQKRDFWRRSISNFFFTKVFLWPRRSVVPSFSAVLRLEVEEKGEERTIVLIHSVAPSPVVVPDKKSPHVPNNKRKSGCCRACRHPVRSCTILGRRHWQASKKDAACSSCCWWSITWPGAGRCRRTIADVDEPSKKRQLFIFGVPCVRLLSDDEDWDSESRRRSSTQGAAKQPFSTSRPKKISNSFDQSWANVEPTLWPYWVAYKKTSCDLDRAISLACHGHGHWRIFCIDVGLLRTGCVIRGVGQDAQQFPSFLSQLPRTDDLPKLLKV